MSERAILAERFVDEIKGWGWNADQSLRPAESGGKYRSIAFSHRDLYGYIDLYSPAFALLRVYDAMGDDNTYQVFNERYDDAQEAVDALAELRDEPHISLVRPVAPVEAPAATEPVEQGLTPRELRIARTAVEAALVAHQWQLGPAGEIDDTKAALRAFMQAMEEVESEFGVAPVK